MGRFSWSPIAGITASLPGYKIGSASRYSAILGA
jgi:hypothetical protein